MDHQAPHLSNLNAESPSAGHQAPAMEAIELSVVIPMFNELENVTRMVEEVRASLATYPRGWELIVVDDGSTDGTGEALLRHSQRYPEVQAVLLARNFRQTAAMQAGIDAARGEIIVTLDGDLQNDPRDIPKLVEHLRANDLDLVCGWRALRQDGLWLRKVPSKLANALIRRATGLQFRDLGCSLKAYRADAVRRIRLHGEMHRFIPAWMATVTSPSRMSEVPVNHRARVAGRSKYGLSRTFRVLVDLLSVYFFLRFGGRPGHFFGGLGLAVGGAGGLVLAWLAIVKVLLGEDIGTRPLLGLGFLLVVAGVQLLTTGVLAELVARVYHDRNGVPAYHRLQGEPLARRSRPTAAHRSEGDSTAGRLDAARHGDATVDQRGA